MTVEYTHDKFLIGGQWATPSGNDLVEVHSPHNGALVGSLPRATTADIDAAVASARAAFDTGPWPRLTPAERIAVIEKFSAIFATRLDDLARVISVEMGSPLSFSSLAQAPAPWMQIEAFLTIARDFPWEQTRLGALGGDVVVRHEPVGVVAAITPWNVPLFTGVAKLVPALLAGCTVVLKPALEAPLDSFLLAELLVEAGVPEGVVSIVPGDGAVGAHLVAHPGVDKVAFTGSTAVGRQIGSICGQQLKRVSLELGGKSAAIVLADADLDQVVEGVKFLGVMNSGQACVAQSRILAPAARYDEVVEAIATGIGQMRVGDPLDPATEIGPMVSKRQQERVKSYISIGRDEGAEMVIGGTADPSGLDSGCYVQPTVFANVDNRMRIAQEEIFGPVLSIIKYDAVPDAISIANDSDYGLAGTVWTSDISAGLEVARQVRTGTYGVNTYTMDFAAPFGGFKSSGLGREFGPEGLSSFTELKSIYLPLPEEA